MISNKTIHAIDVCALLAGQCNAVYLSTTELALRLALSISYIENILKPLKAHGIVTSLKGPGGGYRICGDISLVSMWDVAAVFEQTCEDTELNEQPIQPYELELEQVVKNTLSSFVLADFVGASGSETKSFTQDIGRFKFKPMAAPFVPKAPNSVFQLHMSF
jgi:Rrf2 family protein